MSSKPYCLYTKLFPNRSEFVFLLQAKYFLPLRRKSVENPYQRNWRITWKRRIRLKFRGKKRQQTRTYTCIECRTGSMTNRQATISVNAWENSLKARCGTTNSIFSRIRGIIGSGGKCRYTLEFIFRRVIRRRFARSWFSVQTRPAALNCTPGTSNEARQIGFNRSVKLRFFSPDR